MLQVGFDLYIVDWILSCVQSMSFVVLLNGATSIFFRYGRGLRQGCPLDPLLFFLIMEGISRAIHHARRNGTLKGIIIGGNVVVGREMLLFQPTLEKTYIFTVEKTYIFTNLYNPSL